MRFLVAFLDECYYRILMKQSQNSDSEKAKSDFNKIRYAFFLGLPCIWLLSNIIKQPNNFPIYIKAK